jgi:methylated-DNA-[protein]-cysteine S-methyltransferase
VKASAADRWYAVWATAWGPIGGVMGAAGLRRLVLPHYGRNDLGELLAWEHPGAARDEGPFAEIVRLSREYFDGRVVDFAQVPCELPRPGTLGGQVLRACREIPYGQTRSYGRLAESIRRPDAARAVAAALGRNPTPLVVPCHRVTYADGRPGGFSAPGGTQLKQRLLALEARRRADPGPATPPA